MSRITKYYAKADGRQLRGLLMAETRKGGLKVLSKTELSELKAIAKARGISIGRKPVRRTVGFPRPAFRF